MMVYGITLVWYLHSWLVIND